MKTPLFSPPEHLLLHALTTLCIGAGCVYPLALSVGLSAPAPLILICCGSVALLFAALDCLPRLRALAYPLLLAAMAAVVFSFRAQLPAIGAALTLAANGQPLALTAYSRPVVLLLCLALTGVGASLSRSEQAFFPLALLCIALLFAVSFLGGDASPLSLLPILLALLLSARAPGVSQRRLIALTALVLALTLALLPLSGQTSPALTGIAARVRQALDDYLFFTEPRTAFSLSGTGYQPLGSSQLGGPASPTDDAVMQVSAPSRTLLRGAVRNSYTGHAWEDTTSGRRYLYVSPRFAALRRDLFDLQRPDAELLSLLPGARTITVLMHADAASTLYLTQRFGAPQGENLVAYFSPASEVFATRSLQAGDSYVFSGRVMDGSTPGIRRAVLSTADVRDPYWDDVCAAYLALPEGIDSRVYALAAQVTASAENDFDRAAALCAYLQNHFAYTLSQSVPPSGQDFVSWFLLEEQRGYCTSFASAMAVMARAIGLPSRYVEGYVAEPDADGLARVTQKNAHAWVEVYFSGFGWLPFDPTPGLGEAARDPEPPDGSQPPPEDDSQDGNEPDGGPQDTPDETPTPSPSPTPTPSPSPTAEPTPSPEQDEARGDESTPTPSPSPTPTAEPTPTPIAPPSPTPPPDAPDQPAPLLWLLLFLLLLAGLIALRLYLCAPATRCAREDSTNSQLLIWTAAITQALSCMGIQVGPGEGPASFLLRAQELLGGQPPLTRLGKALCIAAYSGHRLKPAQVEHAGRVYRALVRRMTLRQRLRLYAGRLLRGLPRE